MLIPIHAAWIGLERTWAQNDPTITGTNKSPQRQTHRRLFAIKQTVTCAHRAGGTNSTHLLLAPWAGLSMPEGVGVKLLLPIKLRPIVRLSCLIPPFVGQVGSSTYLTNFACATAKHGSLA